MFPVFFFTVFFFYFVNRSSFLVPQQTAVQTAQYHKTLNIKHSHVWYCSIKIAILHRNKCKLILTTWPSIWTSLFMNNGRKDWPFWWNCQFHWHQYLILTHELSILKLIVVQTLIMSKNLPKRQRKTSNEPNHWILKENPA